MQRLLARYPAVAGAELKQAMTDAVAKTALAIRPLTPVDTGRLKASIAGRVETLGGTVGSVGGEIRGIVGTEIEYAPYVELGRKPGSLPPSAPLRAWGLRQLGSEEAGEAVRWAILARGIRPKAMFAQGWRRIRPWVSRRFQRALGDIIKRVASGT